MCTCKIRFMIRRKQNTKILSTKNTPLDKHTKHNKKNTKRFSFSSSYFTLKATTWVKRESEQQYKADFAAGRTLGGRNKKAGGIGGALPGGWGAAFSGLSAKTAGTSGSAASGGFGGWVPSWMKAPEPEPEPEPEIVEAVSETARPVCAGLRWVGGGGGILKFSVLAGGGV